ncbi:MAG: iron chelate uptake ABC transporter family permease subunit [Paracoccaceae bacterium]
MLDDFLWRAVLAGVGVALATGPLGSFVLWRRMAYFGDAMAHAAILGVALALAFSISITIGTLVVVVAAGLSVSALADRGHAVDTSLGVLAHSALAVGLVAIWFLKGVRVDLSAFLFGDILTVRTGDLIMIWTGSALILVVLALRWSALLTATLSEDIARSAGIDPARERLVLILLLAVVVALALKVVGALLIAAMLIVPAAAARRFSRSPEAMAAFAVLFGAASAILGVALSFALDSPAGPSVVVVAAMIYVISLIAGR